MFVQSLVQTVRRNVSRALTSSATELGKSVAVQVRTDAFAAYWQDQISKATSSSSLQHLVDRLLKCIVPPAPEEALSPRCIPHFEAQLYDVKELGLRELVEAIYQDISEYVSPPPASDSTQPPLPDIQRLLTPPFPSNRADYDYPVPLRFEHMLILSGIFDLITTHISNHQALLNSDPTLASVVVKFFQALSYDPQAVSLVMEALFMESIPAECDCAGVIHFFLKVWKLEALSLVIDHAWECFEQVLSSVRFASGSPRGRTPVSSLTQSSEDRQSAADQPSPSKREPSSSAESSGDSDRQSPYGRLVDRAGVQREEIVRREIVISHGTLALRLERIREISLNAYAAKRRKEAVELSNKLQAAHARLEGNLNELLKTQEDHEKRFETTKSTVSDKLNKELEELQTIKENTARERSVLEKELGDLRDLVKRKETDLELLKKKEQHISELFCQIFQEMDSLNMPFTKLWGDSLGAIKEGKRVLEELHKIHTEVQGVATTTTTAPEVPPSRFTQDDVRRVIQEWTTEALPRHYRCELELIKYSCEQLKAESPHRKEGLPIKGTYRPNLAEASVFIDRHYKTIENGLRELASGITKFTDDLIVQDPSTERPYEKGYKDCKSLLRSNHQLIFT